MHEESEEYFVIIFKIYYYNDRKIFNFAGSNGNKFGNINHIGNLKKDNHIKDSIRYTFYACGAAILIKRNLYEKIGLFDDAYCAYYEDVDLCWRAWICGYNVIYVPTAFISHIVGDENKNRDEQLYLLERNRLRTFLKNYEFISILNIIPFYIFKKINIISYALSKNFQRGKQLFKILIKALLWNIIKIGSIIKKRKILKKNRKKDDKFLFSLINYLEKLKSSIETN